MNNISDITILVAVIALALWANCIVLDSHHTRTKKTAGTSGTNDQGRTR